MFHQPIAWFCLVGKRTMSRFYSSRTPLIARFFSSSNRGKRSEKAILLAKKKQKLSDVFHRLQKTKALQNHYRHQQPHHHGSGGLELSANNRDNHRPPANIAPIPAWLPFTGINFPSDTYFHFHFGALSGTICKASRWDTLYRIYSLCKKSAQTIEIREKENGHRYGKGTTSSIRFLSNGTVWREQ